MTIQPAELFGEPLASEWEELVERVGASPYLSPGWVAAWWCAFGFGKLEVRVLRRGGRLAGVLPLTRRYGAWRSVTNGHTPQFGLLAEDVGAATELARRLFAGKPRLVSIAAIDPTDDGMEGCRQAAQEAGYRVVLRPFQRSPYLEVKANWPEYESRLSKSLVSDLRRSQRRLDRQGKVSVEIANGRERLQEVLHEAFAVEASGWKGTHGTAIESRAETRRFYSVVGRWAAARDMLRLFFLRLDQRPLAMVYALEASGVCHLLKSGYDASYGRFSPGKLLMRAVVSYCFSRRLSKIEFHGDAEPYKLCWADAVQEQKRFEAYSRSATGHLGWATLVYGRPMAKRVLQNVGMWTPAGAESIRSE